MYTPDNWVILFINKGDPHYRILAGWSGGYLYGNSWRMNSGIVKATEEDDMYVFWGSSGSKYAGRKGSYMLRMNTASIYKKLQDRHGEDAVTMLPEETDWVNFDWIIGKENDDG